jgi:hypothetical protein
MRLPQALSNRSNRRKAFTTWGKSSPFTLALHRDSKFCTRRASGTLLSCKVLSAVSLNFSTCSCKKSGACSGAEFCPTSTRSILSFWDKMILVACSQQKSKPVSTPFGKRLINRGCFLHTSHKRSSPKRKIISHSPFSFKKTHRPALSALNLPFLK